MGHGKVLPSRRFGSKSAAATLTARLVARKTSGAFFGRCGRRARSESGVRFLCGERWTRAGGGSGGGSRGWEVREGAEGRRVAGGVGAAGESVSEDTRSQGGIGGGSQAEGGGGKGGGGSGVGPARGARGEYGEEDAGA